MLFTLCTDDCHSDRSNQYILKYSESLELHQHGVNRLVRWCDNNGLVINIKKTEEIVFGIFIQCLLLYTMKTSDR